MDSEDIEKIKLKIDDLYGRIYTLNDALLQKSEKMLGDGEVYSSIDIFDFYITSHAMAYLRDIYVDDMYNASIYLSARCVLEGLALKKLCRREIIGTIKEELLQKQVFLIEYHCYKKFNDIAEKILLPEKLSIDFKNACTFYEEKLANEYSPQEIDKIVKSQIPFLCLSHINYRKIIEAELGKEYASCMAYAACLLIHLLMTHIN